MSYGSEHIPNEIRQKSQEQRLQITWDSGEIFSYPMEYLRVKCPCADCCGHTPDQAKLIDGKQGVTIQSLLPVGRYALKIAFSDGHDSGVFSWSTLFDLGLQQERYWQEYLEALQAAKKRRKPSIIPIAVVS
ncbi:gamma-butyrobetaine hydroxylase-like domain-containing protein [Candidatus Magnetaquicoccus inordinatus]|uniref:gamma-butyrobetaine hydroxylase-like domain-containing protein n=1 Tax=Candidatus Magnetaquicoccus inordinatus TaxID=2496818 RepID=UPI00102B3ACC|nr:gamma-butyrobetaine hydroxylase-like domain-containing protein [Candidatus Magnetaquicoccus inordinatus]